LDHARDGIFLVDLESGLIVDANSSACHLLGFDCPALIGRPLEAVVDLEQLNWLGELEDSSEEGTVATVLRGAGDGLVPVEVRFNMDRFEGGAYGVVVARDISEREQAKAALREREALLRNFIESTPLGIHLYQLNEQKQLIFSGSNPAADAILGLRHQSFIGRTLQEVFPALAETEVPDRYREVCQTGLPWKNEQIFYLNDKIQGAFEVHAFSTGTGCMAAMFMDISERKRAEEALQESSRMKSEFISTAAHELRTPLTSIRGFAQLLVGNAELTPEEQRESLAYIHQKTEALSRILDDLLDIARVESGQALPLKMGMIRVDELFQPGAAYLKTRSAGYHLLWSLEEGDLLVSADRERIGQVMENLLSNALKYSPPGTEIGVSGQRLKHEYLIAVSDQGIGMTSDQALRVFDKFFRADSSNTAISGLGLGMSIVRDLVESHGGRVWVESLPGEGTRFFFTLPLAGEDNLSGGTDH